MLILSLETSCDETACAILKKEEDRITILSKVLGSSSELHAKYGGVIPDQSAREQLKTILPVIQETLRQAQCNAADIDTLAVTQGPGLIGSLLIGVETAKALSIAWNKPLIPVNHLSAHFYANWVTKPLAISSESLANSQQLKANSSPSFPAIGLLISGGHTDIILMKNHNNFDYLGGTRDDAAGECFDKCARLLNLPYPGGPNLSKMAEGGDPTQFKLPRPMWDSGDSSLSFSGLKTAVSLIVAERFKIQPGHYDKQSQRWIQRPLEEQLAKQELLSVKDLCASIEETIIDILIKKTFMAIQKYNIEQLIIAGGVASNSKLQTRFFNQAKDKGIKLHIPSPSLCTDNAVMVGAAAFFLKPVKSPLEVEANPNLSLQT